jgi:hypothetical protein
MQRLQAHKFELMPNGEQTRKTRRFAGAWWFVYNQGFMSAYLKGGTPAVENGDDDGLLGS